MAMRPWKDGLFYEESVGGSVTTYRKGKPQEEQRGTALRDTFEPIKTYNPDEWAAENAPEDETVDEEIPATADEVKAEAEAPAAPEPEVEEKAKPTARRSGGRKSK